MKLSKCSKIALVIMCVQFINALEFMIIAPIAPSLLIPFNINLNQIGILTGSYTCSAIFSGLLGFIYLDRFNKKQILYTTLGILSIANFLSIFCTDIYMIVVIRLIAGFFGGITLALGMALVIDNTLPKQHGKALSITIMAFPLVSILGIPSGIWLIEQFNYQILFVLISLMILVVILLVYYIIPSNEIKLPQPFHQRIKLNKTSILAISLLGIAQFPIYLLIPSLAIILKYTMHTSNQSMPFIFMASGIASLITTKIYGHLINKLGVNKPINCATTLFILVLIFGIITMKLPPIIFMILLMSSVYIRITAVSLVTSKHPQEHQRSGFNALQSAISNISATIAGLASSWLLIVKPDESLGNLELLASITIVSAILLPLGLFIYQKALKTQC